MALIKSSGVAVSLLALEGELSNRSILWSSGTLFARGKFNDRGHIEDPAGEVLDQDLVASFGEFLGLGESLLC